ncbi:hypothetical protein GCM10025857_14920 [Alicyclobacillus contaminans]|uniref:SU10 major capsid protein n=1 Tax=Alicyclobacillus contaminans TaxID=392016 RepID=UPI00040242B9|nr:DUF5309 family protein [Alicyclobacillus contaminans]GMA50135.1 hypothetical protein GCM10025857_14920 [Alicyclobacillus contaminans]
MAMDMAYVRKAMDTVAGANYERKDLSAVITLVDGPPRPLLQAIQPGKAKGKTHYWNEVGLVAPTGSTGYYPEGGKPTADNNVPNQLSNHVMRVGKTAAVTDSMAAVWTGAGSYRLADGEMERLFQEAIDLQTELKTTEVLNEVEYIFINGDTANNSASVDQCDGLVKVINAGNGAVVSAQTDGTALEESLVRDLAKQIADNKPAMYPDLLLVTPGQREVVNTWRPQIITSQTSNLKAGYSVDTYDTGFFTVTVKTENWLPAGTMLLVNSKMLSRADLIPLGAETLARVGTSLERMVTTETTLEYRMLKSFGKITGLAV